MSLILEALKKSEAERQLGRAPGLMTPMAGGRRRGGVSPWWGIGVLAVAIAAALAWIATRSLPLSDPAPPVAGAVPVAATAAEPASDASPTAPATASAQESSRAAMAPAQSPQAAVPAEPSPNFPAPSPALMPNDPAFASVERESLPVSPPEARGAQFPESVRPSGTLPTSAPPGRPPAVTAREPSPPATVPAAAVELPESAHAPTPGARPTASPGSPTAIAGPGTDAASNATGAAAAPLPDGSIVGLPAGDPAALPTVDATPIPTPDAASDDALEALPRVGELMPHERDALPALRMTMHVFAPAPEARAVLIDGRRLREGDRLAPSLLLAEIRRDGAVLDFNGRRILLPRP